MADYQLYLVGLVSPVLLFDDHFPCQLVFIGWSLLALPWICRLVTHSYLTYPTLTDPLILLLLVTVLASSYITVEWQSSFDRLTQLAVGISLFYGFINVRPTRASRWLPIIGLLIIALGLAISAPLIVTWTSSRFFLEPIYARLTPVISESLDANILAAILSMTLLIPVALIWRGQLSFEGSVPSRKLLLISPKIILGFAALLLVSAQAFTQSRGAAVGLAIGIFALRALYNRKLLLLLPIITLTIYLMVRTVGFGVAGDLLLSVSPAEEGWAGRWQVWSHAMTMLRTMPFTGIGMGTFPQIQSFRFASSHARELTHAHNLFLQVGVDLGVPGLVAYVGIVTSCLIMALQAWRRFRRAGHRNLEALSAGVFAALIAMITHGLVDAPLWGTKPSVVAWYFMGLAAMLFVHSHESPTEPTRSEISTPS